MTWARASWWSWLITAGVLVAGRLGWAPGVPIAIAVTATHALVIAIVRRRSLPVQVRVTYTIVLVIGIVAPVLHWMQLAGTVVLLVVDYCVIARFLALAPWNRRQPLTLALVRAILLTPPVKGSIVDEVQRPRAS